MNSELLEKVKLKSIIPIGIIVWILGFIWSIVVMSIIGFDYENEKMGIDHEQYWEFELLMTPVFIIIGLLFLTYYFLKSDIPAEEWKTEGVVSGVIVMVTQFIFDLIVIVIALDSGVEYYIGLVTISYLLIPVWAVIAAYYVRVMREG
ncbi:MAG: hypothetical protein ACFFDT_14300 [Candidatus Hodarchaeota archaeon]